VVKVLNEGGDFNHGFTYSGHPVAAAVALENIRILRDEQIIDCVREETAPYLQQRLRELADHPLVGEVRGVGMLGAIELVKNKQTRERFQGKNVGMICRGHCFDNGLIMRAVGDTMIISPPLVISLAEIDELVSKARKCLDLTAQDVIG
jgi:putrescine aminotransferase